VTSLPIARTQATTPVVRAPSRALATSTLEGSARRLGAVAGRRHDLGFLIGADNSLCRHCGDGGLPALRRARTLG